MSFVSGAMAVLDELVAAVDEPLSEQAERVTTAKETRQTSMRYFIAEDYARGMPKVKWEEWPSALRRSSVFVGGESGRRASKMPGPSSVVLQIARSGYCGPLSSNC
jgi:hypothetical protein